MITLEHIITPIAPHHCVSCGAPPSPLCGICCKLIPLAPKCCYKCARPIADGLCITCSQSSHLQSIAVHAAYSGLTIEILKAFKFNRVKAMASVVAGLMAPHCPNGLIVPIPTAATRLRQRGYDQAVLIARYIAECAHKSYAELLHRKGSSRQLGQTRNSRQRQLTDAYYVSKRCRPPLNTPILLIDDVITTGATIEAAAAVLQKEGYTQVRACLFAWSPP